MKSYKIVFIFKFTIPDILAVISYIKNEGGEAVMWDTFWDWFFGIFRA